MAISSSLPDMSRNTDNSEVQKPAHLSDTEVLIAVMGPTGVGKSTFINLVSGSQLDVGHRLRSCTDKIQLSKPFFLDGRYVTLVDTPGFDDTDKSDTDILKMIGGFLATSYEKGKKLSGIIYMYRISDIRMTGTSKRNFSVFRKLCGTDSFENIVLVTTRWSDVTQQVGEQPEREKELKEDPTFWKAVLDGGATTVRHDNTLPNANGILRPLVLKKPKALLIQQQMVDRHMSIGDTAAGSELTSALQEQAARHKGEMEELRAEIAALKKQDEKTRKEMAEDLRMAEEKLESVQMAAASLKQELQDEKRNAKALFDKQDAAIAKLAEEHRAEMEELLKKERLESESLKRGYDNETKPIELERPDLPPRPEQIETDAMIAAILEAQDLELKLRDDRYKEKERECENLKRHITTSRLANHGYLQAKDKGEQMVKSIPGAGRIGRKAGGTAYKMITGLM